MERGDDNDDSKYASYSRLYSSDEGSVHSDERFTMECSSNRFLNGCSHIHGTNILVYEGGTQHEEHGNTSTINRYCVNASVLEDQINQCVSRSLNVHHHLNIRCNSM